MNLSKKANKYRAQVMTLALIETGDTQQTGNNFTKHRANVFT